MDARLGNNPEAALYKWSLTRVVGSSQHLRFSHNCLYIIFALYLQSQTWYTAAVGYKTGVGITINPYEFNILAYTLIVVFAISYCLLSIFKAKSDGYEQTIHLLFTIYIFIFKIVFSKFRRYLNYFIVRLAICRQLRV